MSETELTQPDAVKAVVAAAEGQPLAPLTKDPRVPVEVRLRPLPLRPELQSSQGLELAEPAAGFWRYGLFIFTVVVPMMIGAAFLLFIATPRYSSTASFVVKSTDGQGQGALSSLAQSAMGGSVVSNETYAVDAYLTSRDIVGQLAQNDSLRAILSRPQGDFVFRYPTFWMPDNDEFLYRRFQSMAKSDLDEDSGITTIEVNAFTAEDAQALVRAMLGYAEDLVNRMNDRMYSDQLAAAERFVDEAQKNVGRMEAELKAFRNASGSVDPMLVAQSKLKVIEGLSESLAQTNAAIAQQIALAPTSPALAALRAQAQSYRDEIEKRKLEIAGSTGSEAVKLETYDLLTTRRDLAAQALSDAVTQRDQARQQADQQHLFIQIIAQPNLARDYARYPQTTLNLSILLALCLTVFQVLRKVKQFTAEHRP